ncbi:MAG: hypothetical protein Q8Q81_14870 [Oxalobacteraceae bacterium]|nr:hypothetical protein [Oxalobacteraceae bacterium]
MPCLDGGLDYRNTPYKRIQRPIWPIDEQPTRVSSFEHIEYQ